MAIIGGFWEPTLKLSVAFLLCCAPITTANADDLGLEPDVKHMALIIGVADYDRDGTIRTGLTDMPSAPGSLQDLKNPCHDAELFKARLLAARWKAEEIIAPPCNLTTPEIREYITRFRMAVTNTKNTVAIFYFSGHGAQFSNSETSHSFLFGAGARVDLDAAARSLQISPGNTSFLATEAIDLHELLGSLGRQPENAVLIVLDACRDNPLYFQMRDLSPSLSIAPISHNADSTDDFFGIVVAYSSPNGTYSLDGPGDHSIYTDIFSGLLKQRRTLDSVLNSLRLKVAAKYRDAYPNRTGTQEPVIRGRFAADWCVWACQPSADDDPVAALERPEQSALALSNRVLAKEAPEDGVVLIPSFGARSLAVRLMSKAAFQDTLTGAASATPQKLPVFVPHIFTLFDKSAQPKLTPTTATPSVPAEGMNFDIFWCDEGAGAEDRAKRATNIAAALAGEANDSPSQKLLSEKFRNQISSVRVRTLSASANTISGYRYKDDVVVYDPDIKSELQWAYAVARLSKPALKPAGEGSHSSGYMSVFVCKGPKEDVETRSKLFLQVPANDQKIPGQAILRDITRNVPSINVIRGIEVRPDGPIYTEVRFYYQQDRDNAFSLTAELEKLLKRGIKLRYMPRLAPKTKPGLLELWLGRRDPPLVVDEGGNLTNRPGGSD